MSEVSYMTTVGKIYGYLDKIAPFNNQDKPDNAGLLSGDYSKKQGRMIL